MTRPFSSIPDGHGTVTLYRHVERGDSIVVAVRRDTPADPQHLAAPPALDPDVYDLLAAVADPSEQVVERPEPVDPADVRVGDIVEVEAADGSWMARGEVANTDLSYVPPRLLIHVATADPCWLDTRRASVRRLRRAEPQPDPEQVEAVYYLLGERHPSLPIAELRETARELVRRGVVVRDEH